MIGKSLTHFNITAKLGEGGMGEVYRATDTKLGREVAIKVLPEAVAADADRMARFQREAKLLAALHHTNIAGIFAIESAVEVGDEESARPLHFLVMELAGGEDLAQRLLRGPIPLDEVLPIARQIAVALEVAHENGIIHRDLKPANIKVSDDGHVKVLDFGLAKAFDPSATASGSSSGRRSATPSLSPTLTAQMTVAGVLLGTAAYMSPEQARGKPVDRRADVWAFGCVLYEMLAGRRPFEGETVTDVLAAVLKTDPDWKALPADTPSPVRRLLRRCLTRDPKDRLRDIADARLEIDETELDPSQPGASRPLAAGQSSAGAPSSVPASTWQRWLPWTVTAAALALVAVIGFPPPSDEPVSARQAVRFSIDIGHRDLSTADLPFTVSPDGSVIAYASSVGTATKIFLRRLDELKATPIPGIDDGHAPFFSPDGQSLGFFSNGRLMKVPIAGGNTRALAAVPHAPGGADWSEDGQIIFSTAYASRAGLYRVPDRGGEVEQLTVPDLEAGESYHFRPQILPDQNHVLFTIEKGDQASAAILSLKTGEWQVIPGITGRARYLTSGHLLYGESSTLLAVPFDLDRLEPTGPPVAVMEGLPTHSGGAGASVQVSRSGVLVYDGADRPQARLAWVDRAGEATVLPIEPDDFHWPRLSPDGKRVVVTNFDQFYSVVHNLERGGRVKLENSWFAFWEPVSDLLLHSARQAGIPQITRRQAGGGGEIEQLSSGEYNNVVTSATPDGRYLVYYEQHPDTSRDLWVLDLEGDGTPEPLIVTEANERSARLSPDGRWLAYTSNRSGRDEVYVRRFVPRGTDDILISRDGGREPVWGPDGSEIFYRAGNALLAAPIIYKPELEAGAPAILFEGNWAVDPGGLNQMYDVSPDGDRFLMIQHSDDLGKINIVVGWSPGSN